MDEIVIQKLAQAFLTIMLFIMPSVLVAVLSKRRVLEYLQMDSFPTFASIFLSIGIIILGAPLINLSAEINALIKNIDGLSEVYSWMHEKEKQLEEISINLLSGKNLFDLLINLIVLALLPALGEEMLFRGVIQRFLIKITKISHIGIIITAFLFSAIHFQFLTFLPRFILGLYLGYIFYWSGCLWVPILAHFANNATIVFLYYFIEQKEILEKVENIGASEHIQWVPVFISATLVISGLYLFYWREKNQILKRL